MERKKMKSQSAVHTPVQNKKGNQIRFLNLPSFFSKRVLCFLNLFFSHGKRFMATTINHRLPAQQMSLHLLRFVGDARQKPTNLRLKAAGPLN